MLTEQICTYLALERGLGRSLKKEESFLRSFAGFAKARGEAHVRNETAILWAGGARSPYQRERRLDVLRRFARYVHIEDAAHEIPPAGVFATRRRPRRVPHIYSEDEISRILTAASRLGPAGSLRPHTFAVIFGLLAATGLRVSEVLALRVGDIIEDRLLVRRTKFRKTRLIPVHESTSTTLQRYLLARAAVAPNDDHVFVSLRGRGLRYPTVLHTFRSLCAVAGLGSRPHIHDLRHTFAVRALEASPQEGRGRIGRHMRALSLYLGHTCVADTYWYCHATPNLMRDIADAAERHFAGGTP